MLNNAITKSRVAPGVCFVILAAIFGLTSCGGGTPTGDNIIDNPAENGSEAAVLSTIATKQAEIEALPLPSIAGNTVHYFCDCTGTGATCADSGNDAWDGSSPAYVSGNIGPKKSWTAAVAWVSGSLHHTSALCRNGAWNASASFERLNDGGCPSATYCNELREYGTGAKPRINNGVNGIDMIRDTNGTGGLIIMNLEFRGAGWSSDGLSRSMVFFSTSAVHDILFANNTVSLFDKVLVPGGSTSLAHDISVIGNDISEIQVFGISGSPNNYKVNYNKFVNVGNNNSFNHSIYIGTQYPRSNFEVIGNHLTGYAAGGFNGATECRGAVISAGGQQANFTIAGNYISEPGSGSGCYGIAAGDHGYTSGAWLQNFHIENNTIIDAGNRGILLQECTDCVISSNVLIYTQGVTGIALPANAARTTVPSCTPDLATGKVCNDTPSTRGRVINNTIYSTSAAIWGVTGIVAGFEGDGYIIANNSVVYMGTSSNWPTSCFNYNLDPSAYEFINNNHCYVPSVSYKWEYNHGDTLSAWQSYSGFDTSSITGVDPIFADPGTDFTPMAGSPLLHAGSSVYKSAFDYFGNERASVPTIGAVE